MGTKQIEGPVLKRGDCKNLLTREELSVIFNTRPLITTGRFVVLGGGEVEWPHDYWTTDINTWPPSLSKKMLENYVCYLRDASRFTKKLNEKAKQLEEIYQCQADAHIYICLNPETAHPFGIHWDNADNYIVQCEGKTRFKVWPKLENRDVNKQGNLKINEKVLIDEVLSPGDTITIPKYYPHLAISQTKRFSVSFPMVQTNDPSCKQDRTWISI